MNRHADEDSLWVEDDDDIIELGFSSPSSDNTGDHPGLRTPNLIPPEHLPGLADLERGHRSLRSPQTPTQRHRHHHHHHYHHHHQHRPHHHHSRHHHHRRRVPQIQQAPPAVIDLTEEPGSPVEVQASLNTSQTRSQTGGNPRRTMSQRISPPSLSRSDGTLSRSPMPDVIDLTEDSPESDTAQPSTRAHHLRPRPTLNHQRHGPQGYHAATDSLFSVGLVPGTGSQFADMRGIRRTLAGFFGGELMALGFSRPSHADTSRPAPAQTATESPKPPMEPVPPTRSGFTRNTCAEPSEEMVVVCPCCNDELAYNPESRQVGAAGPSSGGKKRKRTPGEHHFWALKKCGHVYCADCFEGRRPTKTNPKGAGFPAPDGKDPYAVPNELRCAVEGCDTKIVQKGEWVGLYV